MALHQDRLGDGRVVVGGGTGGVDLEYADAQTVPVVDLLGDCHVEGLGGVVEEHRHGVADLEPAWEERAVVAGAVKSDLWAVRPVLSRSPRTCGSCGPWRSERPAAGRLLPSWSVTRVSSKTAVLEVYRSGSDANVRSAVTGTTIAWSAGSEAPGARVDIECQVALEFHLSIDIAGQLDQHGRDHCPPDDRRLLTKMTPITTNAVLNFLPTRTPPSRIGHSLAEENAPYRKVQSGLSGLVQALRRTAGCLSSERAREQSAVHQDVLACEVSCVRAAQKSARVAEHLKARSKRLPWRPRPHRSLARRAPWGSPAQGLDGLWVHRRAPWPPRHRNAKRPGQPALAEAVPGAPGAQTSRMLRP